jgi:iduronate 2-sulfatase
MNANKHSLINKCISAYILGLAFTSNADAANKQKPNVLFIAVDDLRTELNCYGAKQMHTPNIDRLAQKGVLFEHAYCQQAVCAPSRNTVLTGLRPDALGIYDLSTFFRDKCPDVVALPEHFKNNGYRTESIGKIYHTSHGNKDDVRSWSVPHWDHGIIKRSLKKINNGDSTGLESDYPKVNNEFLPYHCSNAPEENMSDAMISKIAVDRIKALKDSTFFLAVGFLKPHLPFVSPRKYWDLYDPKKIQIPKREVPEGMPPVAMRNGSEVRSYYGIAKTRFLDDETSRNLIHAYYAAVSMIDAQIGKLLEALEENGLSENTIIVFWGDHGWRLGEYGSWGKHSNFEPDTNAPLIFSAPGIKNGTKTQSLAEFVDIYPTLCDLAGLSKPDHLEGHSLLPIFKNPKAEVNKVAISQFPRGKILGYDNQLEIMGYSMRIGKYRFTRWQKYENPSEIIGVELYDHSVDKIATENLVVKSEYTEKIKELDRLLTTELSKYKLLKSLPPEKKN